MSLSLCLFSCRSSWTNCSVPCGEGYRYRWRIPLSTEKAIRMNVGRLARERLPPREHKETRGSEEAPGGRGPDTGPGLVASGCAPYHMEERQACNLGSCPATVVKTQCFWTSVQIERCVGVTRKCPSIYSSVCGCMACPQTVCRKVLMLVPVVLRLYSPRTGMKHSHLSPLSPSHSNCTEGSGRSSLTHMSRSTSVVACHHQVAPLAC